MSLADELEVTYTCEYNYGYQSETACVDAEERAGYLKNEILKKRGHPVDLTRLPYREFLQTDYWQILSWLVKDDREWTCEVCGAGPIYRGLELHHKTYKHRGKEGQYPQDLLVVCGECHDKIHGRRVRREVSS